MRNGSASAASFKEARKLALIPDARRPSQAASPGCETRHGTFPWAGRHALSDFGGPKLATLPSPALLLLHIGRALGRISRCRRPLRVSTNAIGLPNGLWRILLANHREVIRSKTTIAGQEQTLTASGLPTGWFGIMARWGCLPTGAAWDHGALVWRARRPIATIGGSSCVG